MKGLEEKNHGKLWIFDHVFSSELKAIDFSGINNQFPKIGWKLSYNHLNAHIHQFFVTFEL